MRFEEYLAFETELHPLPKLPPALTDFRHLILYGPAGSGKYTLALRIAATYSKSRLKYDRRVVVATTTLPFTLKISDVHCEVDMEQLGCTARLLWHDLFTHIAEMVECTFPNKQGILVCTNFHLTHPELLEVFYSYMQQKLKFILVTEAFSFIPAAVAQRCRAVAVPRPLPESLTACFGRALPDYRNLKELALQLPPGIGSPQPLCDKIVDRIEDPTLGDLSALREDLYALLVHNLNIDQCFWCIARRVLPLVPKERLPALTQQLAFCLQCFANNYRPIFHLEYFTVALWKARHAGVVLQAALDGRRVDQLPRPESLHN